MSLPIPVPLSPTKSDRELSQTLLDIIRRSVDGTSVPLFVDPVSGRVLIGTVTASGPAILQVIGDATITRNLNVGDIFTRGISVAGNVWAGSLTANGSLQAGSAIIAGPMLMSGSARINGGVITNNIVLQTIDGKHTAQVYLDAPDSNGNMALIVNPLT